MLQSRCYNYEEKGMRKQKNVNVYNETYVFIVYLCIFRNFLYRVSYDVPAIILLIDHAILQ